MRTDLADDVDFSIVRYALCWEDADVLLEALNVRPGDTCFSIASAGDNTLSLLCADPAKVIAVDLSASQLACLELRVAAYRELEYAEALELMGVRESRRRLELYARVAKLLSADAKRSWDANPDGIEAGFAVSGRFEHYLGLIRRFALNPTHTRLERDALFERRDAAGRRRFYDKHWNKVAWRLLIRLACSRFVMGRFGRDPRFFRYAEGSTADRILKMIEHAMVELDPADNEYLHWLVHGYFGERLPHALRPENFELIRQRLDRLEWHLADVQSYLESLADNSVDKFNFSDVFEYLSEEDSAKVFAEVARVGRSGGRQAYWNMLVPRNRPATLRNSIRPLAALGQDLHRRAKTFFYSDFVVEEFA